MDAIAPFRALGFREMVVQTCRQRGAALVDAAAIRSHEAVVARPVAAVAKRGAV